MNKENQNQNEENTESKQEPVRELTVYELFLKQKEENKDECNFLIGV